MSEAPPAKRPASEAARLAATTGRRSEVNHVRGTHAMTARARFLQELQQYASDDDDGTGAVGVAVASGSRAGRAGGMGTAMEPHDTGAHSTGAPAAPQPSAASARDGDFFFGGPSGGGEALHDIDLGSPFAGTPSPAPPPAPTRVGLQLLHRMHGDTAATTASPTSPNGFEVVHTYVPLSTGGFLSTVSATEDTMEGHQVRIGDVLSLRKPLPGASASATPSPPPPLPPHPLPPLTAQQQHHSHTRPTAANVSSSSAATGMQAPDVAHDASASAMAHTAMSHFLSAASFTGDEKRYGRRLTPDMTRLLFEVARVDPQGRRLEALFLDGSRAKVGFHDVRPAGYVERAMYAAWRADPASRPVHTIHSDASSPTTATGGGGGNGDARLPSALSAASPSTSPVPPSGSPTDAAGTGWWVIPRLLVRLTAEAAGDWYGKKCVVKTVQRSENRVRLTEWVDESASAPSAAAPETRELIGADGLETVVPKKGGRALVVLGPLRGEMCVVRARVRGPDGDLSAVEVEMSRTKDVVTLQADELCALAR